MAKLLKFGNAILCEFVAKGDRNKHTLVNVFSGDVVVQEMPAELQFGIYIEYFPLNEGALELWLHIKLDDELLLKAQVSLLEGNLRKPSTIIIPAMKVSAKNDVEFSVEASCEGFRKTTVISKRIYRGEIPSA